MDNEPIDLKKLAEEAAREAYTPRAEKCWPWSHQWTMWRPHSTALIYYGRICLRCGKPQNKPFY